MRSLLVVALLACRSREAPPPPPPAVHEPPPPPSPREAGVHWSGEPIAPRVVAAVPTKFALGTVSSAFATRDGWIATKFRDIGKHYTHDIVDEHGVIASDEAAQILAGDDATYIVFRTADAPTHVSRLVDRKLVPMTGAFELHWAFGGVGIANDTTAGLATQHWQTIAIDHDKLSVVETSDAPYATGATRLGSEIIVATREHDPKASTTDKANAVIAAQNGDAANLGRIVGQPRGWLLHVDAKGHVVSKELFTDQTPGQVAATRSGWLLILTEGTAGRMFKDGVLLGRAPTDPALHVLARNLELGSQLIAVGDWACFYTMPGEGRVVHCVDPVRRLYITSELFRDEASLYGIELVPAPRVILHHTWYRDGYAKPPIEETLALALP